ncbi:MAG: 6-bladed beta-propeller [Clostridia bacterium]|nr:6-bladed beta-propeller [Clostridia bacterium]
MTIRKILILAGLIILGLLLLWQWEYGYVPQTKYKSQTDSSFSVQETIMGTGKSSLLRPLAVTMDDEGQIYVADSSHHRIMVFDLHNKVVAEIGKPGTGQGELDYPTAVGIKGNKLYVGDSTNYRIQVFSKYGDYMYYFPKETENLGKIKPVALTLDSQGNVYVADGAGQRILVFDEQGKFLRSFGKAGNDVGEFSFPNGLALDEAGQNLYVSDFANGRIQVFSPEGKFKKKISAEAGFTNPRGLAYNQEQKQLYVADIFNHRIVVLNEKGENLGNVGSIGAGPQQFNFPNGLWYGKGTLLVADRENNRVMIINTGGSKGKE